MDLSKVMAISGKSGLFKIISQSRGSIIAESLTDGKKLPIFATHRSSVLEDISMFTYTEDIPLKKVLWAIFQKEDGKKVSIDLKADGNILKNYFESVLPDYDQDRVYASDIKKVLAWYNQLVEHNLVSEPIEEEPEAQKEEEPETEKAADKKEKKAAEPKSSQEAEKPKKTAKKTEKKATPAKKNSGKTE
jgi:hypothetical protein